MGILIVIHLIICALLISIILVQRGRGGGLAESFSGVESMFGTKTNVFLTRTTTILAILFFISCVSLALLSVKQSRSLMRDIKTQQQPAQTQTQEIPGTSKQERALPESLPTPSTQAQTSPELPKQDISTQEAPK